MVGMESISERMIATMKSNGQNNEKGIITVSKLNLS